MTPATDSKYVLDSRRHSIVVFRPMRHEYGGITMACGDIFPPLSGHVLATRHPTKQQDGCVRWTDDHTRASRLRVRAVERAQ
jgi:hypothetical protein